jgi:hypothetical protein
MGKPDFVHAEEYLDRQQRHRNITDFQRGLNTMSHKRFEAWKLKHLVKSVQKVFKAIGDREDSADIEQLFASIHETTINAVETTVPTVEPMEGN